MAAAVKASKIGNNAGFGHLGPVPEQELPERPPEPVPAHLTPPLKDQLQDAYGKWRSASDSPLEP